MPYFLHRPGVTLSALQVPVRHEYLSWGEPSPANDTSAIAEACCCGCADSYWRQRIRHAAYLMETGGYGDFPTAYLAVFDTAQAAHEAHKALHTSADPVVVTFNLSDADKSTWRYREERRKGVQRLPWTEEGFSWFDTLANLHWAYLSIEAPGMICYTPSEEWGANDRQLRVRPGRYLEQFASHLSQSERDTLCARIKALQDSNVVKFAATADDIEAVYRQGPNSCMCHDLSEFACNEHPTRVYGDSDLQVAYLGELGPLGKRKESGNGVRARAVVWPDKRVYSRVYGDETLRILLERDGYTLGEGGHEYGNLSGARVRQIPSHTWRDDNVYVMPYIDSCSYVERKDGDSTWLYLGRPDHYRASNGRTFFCRETNGLTDGSLGSEDDEPEETYTCSGADGCENDVSDDGNVCRSCLRAVWTCRGCDETSYDRDASFPIGDGDYCESCSNDAVTCESCEEFFMESQYRVSEQRQRDEAGVTDFCRGCAPAELERREAVKRRNRVPARPKGRVLRAHVVWAPAPAAAPVPAAPALVSSDGVMWWRAVDASFESTHWGRTADGRTFYTSVGNGFQIPERSNSEFDTLDNSREYMRVPDPRIAHSEGVR